MSRLFESTQINGITIHIAEEIVTSGFADYVALSRPLIREPGLVKRWAAGDREKAACISCNKCFSTLAMEEALHCAMDKKESSNEEKGANHGSK